MKQLITTGLVLLLFTKISFAQQLKFDKEFYNAIDKWAVFQGKGNNHSLGFIYIDPQAGFTFDFQFPLVVTNEQLQLGQKDPSSSLKYRLEKNTALVHILTEQEVKELNLPKEPDWLQHYKVDQNTLQSKVQMGYTFNHIGQNAKAILYLQEAYKRDPHFQGLEFELAYAYNALGDFENSIEVLQKAIKNNPTNFWFYRELGYAYLHSNNIEKATESYTKALKITQDPNQKAEIAINMAIYYFTAKEKESFKKWVNITKENTTENSQFRQYIAMMEKDWDVER